MCLVSPETAAASALRGVITDPRTFAAEMDYPPIAEPKKPILVTAMFCPPVDAEEARVTELVKGPNIASLPNLNPLPDEFSLPVLLTVGDNISTDEILPAGARVLPFRSNIPAISQFAFEPIDPDYPARAAKVPRRRRPYRGRRPELWARIEPRACGFGPAFFGYCAS